MSTTRLYRYYRGKTNSYRVENFYRDIAKDKISPIPTENPFHVDTSSLTPAITLLCPTPRAAVESETVELQTKDILKVELRAGVGHLVECAYAQI